jgi:ribosomal protein S18 acetylase RimI-like enzyme
MGGEFDETRGNGVRLRGASEADETTLAAFMRQLREDDPEEGRFDEARCVPAMRRMLTDPSLGRAWLIEASGETAGYVVLTLGYSIEFGGVAAFVDELFVARGKRRQGIGTATLKLVEAEARALGVAVLLLEVTRSNEAAKHVYRKAGFSDREHHLMTIRLQ